LQDGLIRNLPAAVSLLQPMLRKSRRFGMDPIAIACIPTTASVWDRQRLHEVLLQAGCSSVEIIQEGLAAAIGAGLDVGSEYAQMLIDIGEGVTDLVIIQEGQLVRTRGLNIAYGAVHASIQRKIYERHRLWLSVSEVRRIARTSISMAPGETISTRGSDQHGNRTEIQIEMKDVLDAMQAPISLLIDATVQFLRELPDEVACQVIETGITLTGGGALLPGLAQKLKSKTSLEIHVGADPLHSVIQGAARAFLG
jgi:rod shape-determining protein MreB